MSMEWNALLLDQLTWHWEHQARPRLEGLSDEEYLWEPVPGCWSLRPRGTSQTPMSAGAGDLVIDFDYPEPAPSPVTTIGWRMAHIIVGVLGMRTHSHFGGPPADYQTWNYAATPEEALAQLDDAYAAWIAGVGGLDEEGLLRPCGSAEGPWAEAPMAALVLHINREAIHHLAEIALLRDLFAHRFPTLGPEISVARE